MTQRITKVLVLGGGSAGWLCAARIAAKVLGSDIQVSVIESPNIATVGVGEGTWPTMRSTLMNIGITETEFIRRCDASFKQGAKFQQWCTGKADDFYYHPLMLPNGFNRCPLAATWQQSASGLSFSDTVCAQEALCERGLAPKTLLTPEFEHLANYAYHLDAGKFSQLLKGHCIGKLGVEHICAEVKSVECEENGDIAALKTVNAGDIAADLFIDCSGFHSRLIGEHYQVPLKSCRDILFADTALALHIPYPDDQADIASHTIATAQRAGWIWDIGLGQRRGVGHVYSSQYLEDQQALQTLADYLSLTVDSIEARKIRFCPGYRQQMWKNNCVAVGLAAGFIEPLEASALVLVELAAEMLAEEFPHNRHLMAISAKRYNRVFEYRWQRIIDFLKLHYVLSKRTDHPFWLDNRHPQSIPDNLCELLELWQFREPSNRDFDSSKEVFPAASYQYVLYGMGFQSEFLPNNIQKQHSQVAEKFFENSQRQRTQLIQQLPSNRELLNKIHRYGLKKI